jgi:dihydrofolate reductase
MLTLIAAVARNGTIGKDNALPWRLSADLKRFKALTTGHPILMGRKTWESLGRPLPGRHNIVITRNAGYRADGVTVVHSIQAAIDAAIDATSGDAEAFVIGGEEIYRLALPLADRLQLTEIGSDFAGDAVFPAFDRSQWQETFREPHEDESGLPYAFVTYARVKQP